MASDRRQFETALAKWEELGRARELSAPIRAGRSAIISSPFTDSEPGTDAADCELAAFRREAMVLSDRLMRLGVTPELALDATRHDIDRLVADPGIVSVYVIGNGSLSTLILGIRDFYDWRDLAAATTHRKLGIFVQRQCGGLTRRLNVPLGLFALDEPRRVFAAVGEEEFDPQSLDDPENAKIGVAVGPGPLHYAAFTLPNDATQAADAGPFGNFSRRFVETRAVIDQVASDEQIAYVRMVKERFGLDLVDFHVQHQELCDSIVDAVQRAAAGEVETGADPLDRRLERAYRLMERFTLNVPFLMR